MLKRTHPRPAAEPTTTHQPPCLWKWVPSQGVPSQGVPSASAGPMASTSHQQPSPRVGDPSWTPARVVCFPPKQPLTTTTMLKTTEKKTTALGRCCLKQDHNFI